MPAPTPKARIWWTLLPAWIALDLFTKHLALARLQPHGAPYEVIGEWIRFRLAFNRGAAMGIHLGDWSRVAFTVIGVGVLGILIHLYRKTDPSDRLRAAVLALITGGAIGNLWDRVRWTSGVVDFIDIGIGTTRFWTFNVADSGITVGAIALALLLGREDKADRAAGG